MPRDLNGNYTLPAGNPVQIGTIIQDSWANPTMDDIAAALSDSLSRSGSGGMLVPFENADGIVNAPGITFTNEGSLGFYRPTTGVLGMSVGGSQQAELNSTDQLAVYRNHGTGLQKFPVVDIFELTAQGESVFDSKFDGFENTGLHEDFTDDLNNIVLNSVYSFHSSNVTNEPSDMNGRGYIRTFALSGVDIVQVIYGSITADQYKQWMRTRNGAGWDAWKLSTDGGAMTLRYAGFEDTGLHELFAADLDDISGNSTFNIQSGGVTNEPVGFVGQGFIHTFFYSLNNTNGTQVLYGMDGVNVFKQWMRHKTTSVWSAWKLVVSQIYGELKMLPGGTPAPSVGQGWLPAKGSLQLRSDFPDLFDAISGVAVTEAAWTTATNSGANGTVLWSTGDLSTTFRVPDFGGEFLRGSTGASNRDPDQPGRGTDWQNHEIISHTHTEEGTSGLGGTIGAGGAPYRNAVTNPTSAATGGNETRPRNLVIDYYIFAGGVA